MPWCRAGWVISFIFKVRFNIKLKKRELMRRNMKPISYKMHKNFKIYLYKMSIYNKKLSDIIRA